MTTGDGHVRFNPNLYESGKVCLSILGTWQGPPWTPAMNLQSVVLSIQSLLNKEPFYNEPGYTKSERYDEKSQEYTDRVTVDTLKVAVLGMVMNKYADTSCMPKELKEKVHFIFIYHYDEYMDCITANMQKNEKVYQKLKKDFVELKAQIDAGKQFY